MNNKILTIISRRFSGLNTALQSIPREDVCKLAPMLVLLFLLVFNHNILWNLKDALMITSSGAEVIPFIKVWAILPGVIFLTMIYAKLSNFYSQERIFYLMTGAFLLFFGIFAFFIYPNHNELHPNESALVLENTLPAGFKGLISMYRYWTFTCFYVMSELWNTMIISVLFWGFANRVTHLSEAPRFYSALVIVSNAAIFIAGMSAASISGFSTFNPWIPFGNNAWEQIVMLLTLLVISSGLLGLGVFRWIHLHTVKSANTEILSEADINTKEKKKLSLRESLSYVGKSRYLTYIAIIVVAYNLYINLIEVVWKDQLLKLYPTVSEYNSYIGGLQAIQGVLAIVFSLGLVKMLKHWSWTKTAFVTPLVMLSTCALFFSVLFFQNHLAAFFLTFGTNPLGVAVTFGTIQVCMSKACKNSIFDSTKEMAYIPLSEESRLKGKAAIDGLGARFGKSGSSIIYQGLLLLFYTVSACVPYIAFTLLFTIVCWITAISRLHKRRQSFVYASLDLQA